MMVQTLCRRKNSQKSRCPIVGKRTSKRAQRYLTLTPSKIRIYNSFHLGAIKITRYEDIYARG